MRAKSTKFMCQHLAKLLSMTMCFLLNLLYQRSSALLASSVGYTVYQNGLLWSCRLQFYCTIEMKTKLMIEAQILHMMIFFFLNPLEECRIVLSNWLLMWSYIQQNKAFLISSLEWTNHHVLGLSPDHLLLSIQGKNGRGQLPSIKQHSSLGSTNHHV